MMIVNDDARVINKLEASLTDGARVIIYYGLMFIVQATDITRRSIVLIYPFSNDSLVVIFKRPTATT
jgi:hypothetical protein